MVLLVSQCRSDFARSNLALNELGRADMNSILLQPVAISDCGSPALYSGGSHGMPDKSDLARKSLFSLISLLAFSVIENVYFRPFFN
jgi:hypothetical protein